MNTLFEPNIHLKLQYLELTIENAYNRKLTAVPVDCYRDIDVKPAQQHPPKLGLSFAEGQARLLHDLGNIELQAMELALRTLAEYPQAPDEFRKQLAEIARSEGRHLMMCLDGIRILGFRWGDWPIHNMLWNSVSPQDDILDRILIVHLYLEGSGLDASHHLLNRLAGVPKNASKIHDIIQIIAQEELDHVQFGTFWFNEICQQMGFDHELEYARRFETLKANLPKRIEKINPELRKQAGFSREKISVLENHRNQISKF